LQTNLQEKIPKTIQEKNMAHEGDLIIQNKPGTYYLGNVVMTITKDKIIIAPNQQAIQQYQQPVQQPTPFQQQQGPQVMQPGSGQVAQPANPADRLQDSTLKTVAFLNKFLWG
jgi:hypothetical protein